MQTNKQPDTPASKHPTFARVEDRFESGINYKWDSIINKNEIQKCAEYGLFFKELGYPMCCYQCGVEISWSPGIDLLFEHVKNSPQCYHLGVTVDPARLRLYKGIILDSVSLSDHGENRGFITGTRATQCAEKEQPVQHATEPASDSDESQIVSDRVSNPITVQSIDEEITETPLTQQGIDELPTPVLYNPFEGQTGHVSDTRVEDLLQENYQLWRQLKCSQCNQNDKNALFLPCAHLIMCNTCCRALNICPICRKAIKEKFVIYRH